MILTLRNFSIGQEGVPPLMFHEGSESAISSDWSRKYFLKNFEKIFKVKFCGPWPPAPAPRAYSPRGNLVAGAEGDCPRTSLLYYYSREGTREALPQVGNNALEYSYLLRIDTLEGTQIQEIVATDAIAQFSMEILIRKLRSLENFQHFLDF